MTFSFATGSFHPATFARIKWNEIYFYAQHTTQYFLTKASNKKSWFVIWAKGNIKRYIVNHKACFKSRPQDQLCLLYLFAYFNKGFNKSILSGVYRRPWDADRCLLSLRAGTRVWISPYCPFLGTVPFYARSCHWWKSFTETIDLNCIARDYSMTDKPIHTLGIVAYPEDFRPSSSSVILLAKAWR